MQLRRSILALAVTAVLATGCSWFGAGEIQRQLEQGSTPRVKIPAGLDQPEFVDAMPIPEIDDPRGLVGVDYQVRMPDVLSTSFGVEQIVIKRLADQSWVFLDVPPAVVWPKVVQFWEVRNFAVEDADPGSGVLVSKWLPAVDGTPAETLTSITEGNAARGGAGASQHKFRLTIEPGIRSGSTEIYLEEKQLPLGVPTRTTADWNGTSDNKPLEDELLKVLAYYLGETINQGTRSLMATGLENRSRAELVPDRETPVLKYKLDFNRAWATVGNALENARVPVEDLDRSSANYYVYYTSDHNPEPGFFSRMFGGGKKKNTDPANRFTVHLAEQGNEVHVTVRQDAAQANSMIAERLLKVIKEYST